MDLCSEKNELLLSFSMRPRSRKEFLKGIIGIGQKSWRKEAV